MVIIIVVRGDRHVQVVKPEKKNNYQLLEAHRELCCRKTVRRLLGTDYAGGQICGHLQYFRVKWRMYTQNQCKDFRNGAKHLSAILVHGSVFLLFCYDSEVIRLV